MKHLWNKIKNWLKIWLLAFFVSMFFLWWVSYGANDLLRQLFDPAVETNNIIDMWENVNTVWQNVFEWSYDITLLDVESIRKVVKTDNNGNLLCHWLGDVPEVVCPQECSYISDDNKKTCKKQRIRNLEVEAWGGITKSPSIIVKVTRLLLTLVITLSVTMILYNWLIYIVQTWQWKEWKSLVKNIVYIVIWIVLSLFSVVIITIIQSVPETIDKEVTQERNNRTDNDAVGDRESVTMFWEKMTWWSYRRNYQ